MEDGSRRGMNMVTAIIARVGRATRLSVMLGHTVALLAKDAIGLAVTLEPLQAGRVIGKLVVEIFLCVLPHCRLAIHRVTCCQGNPNKSHTYCHGIITCCSRRRLPGRKEYANQRGRTMLDLTTIKITHRDEQVLKLLVQGCSNKEIAAQLNISPRTVKQHLRTLFLRAGIRDGRKRVKLVTAMFVKEQTNHATS